jgi:hypothetical protein
MLKTRLQMSALVFRADIASLRRYVRSVPLAAQCSAANEVHRSAYSAPRWRPAVRRTGVTEYWIGTAASVGLDVGRADHLAPLLGFLGDQLAEVGGRARKRRAA